MPTYLLQPPVFRRSAPDPSLSLVETSAICQTSCHCNRSPLFRQPLMDYPVQYVVDMEYYRLNIFWIELPGYLDLLTVWTIVQFLLLGLRTREQTKPGIPGHFSLDNSPRVSSPSSLSSTTLQKACINGQIRYSSNFGILRVIRRVSRNSSQSYFWPMDLVGLL